MPQLQIYAGSSARMKTTSPTFGVKLAKRPATARLDSAEEHVVGYYNTGDRMAYWGKLGAFWGGFWGLLFGSAFFWVPGVGQLLVAGPLVGWIVAALEGAAVTGGLSALGADPTPDNAPAKISTPRSRAGSARSARDCTASAFRRTASCDTRPK